MLYFLETEGEDLNFYQLYNWEKKQFLKEHPTAQNVGRKVYNQLMDRLKNQDIAAVKKILEIKNGV